MFLTFSETSCKNFGKYQKYKKYQKWQKFVGWGQKLTGSANIAEQKKTCDAGPWHQDHRQ